MTFTRELKNGHELRAYYLEPGGGASVKAVPLDALTKYDLDRWFEGTAGKQKDAVKYFEAVAILFNAVTARADTLSNYPRQLVNMESGKVIAAANFTVPQFDDNGTLLDERRLPFKINLNDLLWRIELAQCLVAESYAQALRNRVKVTEVRWLDPRTIQPMYSNNGIDYFVRRVSGRNPFPIAVEDMGYVWRPGLQELGPGVAPAQVAARNAGIADNMDAFIEAFFERGAMPVTIVMAETNPVEPERKRVKAYLERVLTGIGNAFGLEVLNAAIKFETLTPPLKSMVIPEIKAEAKKEILSALRVPESLALSGASNYATARTEDLHFYTKTMNPEATFVASWLNDTLFNPMGLALVFRPDQLEIFQQQEAEKVTAAIELYDRNAIDEDELRIAGGYQPRPESQRNNGKPEMEADDTAVTDDIPERMDDDTPTDEEKRAELRQWERKVLKRFPQTKPYTVPFEPEYLDDVDTAVVRLALLKATTPEEVKAAFAVPFRLPQPITTNGRQPERV